jgi:hypothetical protein
MRKDEDGVDCPATLGEYRDLCAAIGGENCEAVKLLDGHIAKTGNGRDAVVIVPDSQMRALLMPRLVASRPTSEAQPIHEAMAAHYTRTQEGILSMWTVYASPSDFPGKYVARRWDIKAGESHPTTDSLLAERIERLRERFAQMGLHCIPAQPGEDPCIVETWL